MVFAPTIPLALRSPEAVARRGRTLTYSELVHVENTYGEASGTVAIYDPELDWLIFPTSYRAPDVERTVLHEIGHALTLPAALGFAGHRPDLLRNLPTEIAAHIAQPSYGSSNTIAVRVLEVLADAYVWVAVDRSHELPHPVLSELLAILCEMGGNAAGGPRFHFDEETARTATRLDPAEIITADDPDHGHELSPAPRQFATSDSRDAHGRSAADKIAVVTRR